MSNLVTRPKIDVSVIVAVHNGAATIRKCIESVLDQEGCSVELVIVDAMSDDQTDEIVGSYGDRIYTYIREPDHGISDAWNKSIVVARGTWCLFLGADDYFLHSSALVELLNRTRGSVRPPVIVAGAVQIVSEDQIYVVRPPSSGVASHVRRGKMLPHQAMLHNLDALKTVGGFDSSLKVVGDFDATLKLLTMGECIIDNGVHTAMRSGGLSNSDDPKLRRQVEREWAHVIAQHSGYLNSRLALGKHRARRLVGVVIENLLICMIGARRGGHVTLRLRQMLGLRERLNSRM